MRYPKFKKDDKVILKNFSKVYDDEDPHGDILPYNWVDTAMSKLVGEVLIIEEVETSHRWAGPENIIAPGYRFYKQSLGYCEHWLNPKKVEPYLPDKLFDI
jgi:hypothetical protein